MARIQILELPEGSGDDRPPFALVLDQVEPQRYLLGADQEPQPSPWETVGRQLGARAVLVFEETVDIPANEVPIGPDGYPVKIRVEPDFALFRQQVEEEIQYANGRVTRAAQWPHQVADASPELTSQE